MTHIRFMTCLAGAAVILAVAGCGGGASASSTPASQVSGHGTTIRTATEGSLGTILLDSKGRTLYLFKKDSGRKSACFDACASAWPPLRASGKPTVSGAAKVSMVGTTARSDGRPQVTYNGHPLYLFAGDQKRGDTAGQGVDEFGAEWYVLSPAGTQVSGPASNSSGGY